MTNLERAIKDGYAHIIGEKGKEKITYVSSDNHVENYSDPEEKVRAEFWADLIVCRQIVRILLFSVMTSASVPMLWLSVKKTVLRMPNSTRR